MNFGKRLRLYLTGVLLGCIAVYFLLIYKRDRNFTSWLPSNRIYNEIIEKPFDLNDSTTVKYIKCLSIRLDTALVKNIILSATINFSKSKIHGMEDPIYLLETTNTKEDFNTEIQLTKNHIKIVNINSPNVENCKY